MLKIAIVSDAIYPYNKGGKEKRIYEISTRLAKRGHQVTVYCMKWWEGADTRIDEGVQIKAISPYFPLYAGEKRSIKEALLFSFYCLKLIKEDFDILDVDHMPHLVLFSTKLVALLKRKKLYVIWNEVWGTPYWIKYMGPAGLLAALIEKITAMLPDKFTAVSEYTARELTTELKVPQHKITVVPNGISLHDLGAIVPSTSRSDVIFVGRLLSNKNVDVLIQSIALLRKKYPAIKCIVVGQGPEKNNLVALVQKNDLHKNVEFIASIEDHNQLYALMKASRVFAFPSTREGFGIVVLEANGCGLPVITTDHLQNAARYLVKDGFNGKVVSLAKENLADAIDGYMALNAEPARYLSFLQQYDWDNLTQKVEDIYSTTDLTSTARSLRGRFSLRFLRADTETVIVRTEPTPVSANKNALATETVLNIVAHEDDDLLFLSPDLLHHIQTGHNVRTIFVTAGDAGKNASYWRSREVGARGAYAQMGRAANFWLQTDAGIPNHPIPVFTLIGHPSVSLVFLRLPDGGLDGSGLASTHYKSLQKLWTDEISTIDAIDGSSGYTKATLISTLTALISAFQPGQVNMQDYVGTYGDGDHSDHYSVAYFVQAALKKYAHAYSFAGYKGYNVSPLAANVTGVDLAAKRKAFYLYARHDMDVCSSTLTCTRSGYARWLRRQYTVGLGSGTGNPRPASNSNSLITLTRD